MKAYKIFKSSLKIKKIEKTLNKLDSLGYEYQDIVMGRGIFLPCAYIIARTK
ncbi:MAG: hypothetical protein ACI31G_05295 [Bacilli bacterium]